MQYESHEEIIIGYVVMLHTSSGIVQDQITNTQKHEKLEYT